MLVEDRPAGQALDEECPGRVPVVAPPNEPSVPARSQSIPPGLEVSNPSRSTVGTRLGTTLPVGAIDARNRAFVAVLVDEPERPFHRAEMVPSSHIKVGWRNRHQRGTGVLSVAVRDVTDRRDLGEESVRVGRHPDRLLEAPLVGQEIGRAHV